MNRKQVVLLTRTVAAACPQQVIDDYTPDAWFDLLGDLGFDECRLALAAVAKRQPFVAPSEIRAEVKRAREQRLARVPVSAPPAELTDKPGRYAEAVREGVKRIADGFAMPPAIEGRPRDGEPPEEWAVARKALPDPEPPKPDLQELAREQVAESRRERGEPAK